MDKLLQTGYRKTANNRNVHSLQASQNGTAAPPQNSTPHSCTNLHKSPSLPKRSIWDERVSVKEWLYEKYKCLEGPFFIIVNFLPIYFSSMVLYPLHLMIFLNKKLVKKLTHQSTIFFSFCWDWPRYWLWRNCTIFLPKMGGGARPVGVSPSKRPFQSFNKWTQIKAEVMRKKMVYNL